MKRLVKLALIVGAVAAAVKFVTARKAEWEGLTEAEVRAKLDTRLPERMPAEKREVVADRVVAKMRTRGALSEEVAAPEAAGSGQEQPDATDAAAEATAEEDTEPA